MKCEYCKGNIPATHFYRWCYNCEDVQKQEVYAKCDKHFQKAKNMHMRFVTHHMVELTSEEVACFEVLKS